MHRAAFLRTTDLLPEIMLLVSGSGEILAANRAAIRNLGPVSGGSHPVHLTDISSRPPEEIDRYLKASARTRELLPGTLDLVDADGIPVTFRAEGAAFRPRTPECEPLILLRLVPKDTAVLRFLVLNEKVEQLSREIRRRQISEQVLRDQREWFRVVLSSIGDAVIATDDEGRVLFMNPIAESLTGWPIDDSAGRPLGEAFRIVNETTRQTVDSPVDRVIREGVIVGLANHTILIARDGTEWPIDDSAAPIRGSDGRLQGAVLVFRNIGERRAMENELRERAQRLAEEHRRKNEFLAMLAHELRNPLAPLQNTLRLLQLNDEAGEDLHWALDIMDRQVRHMTRLVDDLLDLSRVMHGKIQLKSERVDVQSLVTAAIAAVRPLIDADGHQLTVSLPEDPIPMDVDPARIEQVFTNLLNNASKYTDAGGQIGIDVRRHGDELEIRVRDSGVGIVNDQLTSVFDLFAQADQTLARSQGGLGIGLTLVRTLVRMHGGTVEARSGGLGQGSEFVVRLPIATKADDNAGPPLPIAVAPTADSPDSGKRRVLVVDDLADSAVTLGRLIGRMGYECRVAHDGPAALEAARDFGPDFVLLDIGLPGMDGYEVARQLQIEPATSGAVLIAVTGYGQKSAVDLARGAGFAHYLVKPVQLDQLRKLLNSGSPAAGDSASASDPPPNAGGR